MLIKYYNRIMNLTFEESIIELWDIYHREENEDRIQKAKNSFIKNIQEIMSWLM